MRFLHVLILLLFFTPAAFSQDAAGEEPGTAGEIPGQDIAQESALDPPQPGQATVQPGQTAEPQTAPLPRGFNRLQLGMGLEEAKEELKADGNFLYRGDPDVSMLRTPNDSLIECDGLYYIERASFQFVDGELFTITLIFNRSVLGYFTLYTTLQEKYGEPADLSPEKAVWEDDAVRLSLERPLRIKYIAKPVLDELKRESQKGISLERLSRERFLEQF